MPVPDAIYYVPQLKRLRISRYWTQRELATRSGVSEQNISQLERPKPQRARIETVDALAAALGVTREELMRSD